METISKKIFISLLFTIAINTCFANFYKIDFILKNLPDRVIVLGLVKGDEFIPIDSLMAENELAQFRIPEESQTGVYRINMGQTKYAEVMDEGPQLFDFIFNKEDIIIETDFKSPEKSVSVILSTENKYWFAFKKKIQVIDTEISFLSKELDMHTGEYSNQTIKTAQQYNLLQIERNLFVDKIYREDSTLFAAQMVKTFKTPVLDGYLTGNERKEVFQKEYFKTVHFDNEALIYSQCYTDNVFNYLVSYNDKSFTKEQRIKAYKNGLDMILPNINKNKIVYDFLMEYLKHGFNVLEMQELVEYLSNN